MMMSTLRVLMRPSACREERSQRGWTRTGSRLKGLEMERASVCEAPPVFVKSKNVLCRHLMFMLESDEELPLACFETHVTTFPHWN